MVSKFFNLEMFKFYWIKNLLLYYALLYYALYLFNIDVIDVNTEHDN